MKKIYEGNEFEAVKLRFENQTEQLYRMTMIDLRIFTGFITLQIALGAWLATKGSVLSGELKVGLSVIDIGLTYVACALLRNNALRRKEVAAIVNNCAEALGYKTPGTFLEDEPLDVKLELRLWKNYYYFGIAISIVGVFLVLAYAS
jgi:hypothetical protein